MVSSGLAPVLLMAAVGVVAQTTTAENQQWQEVATLTANGQANATITPRVAWMGPYISVRNNRNADLHASIIAADDTLTVMAVTCHNATRVATRPAGCPWQNKAGTTTLTLNNDPTIVTRPAAAYTIEVHGNWPAHELDYGGPDHGMVPGQTVNVTSSCTVWPATTGAPREIEVNCGASGRVDNYRVTRDGNSTFTTTVAASTVDGGYFVTPEASAIMPITITAGLENVGKAPVTPAGASTAPTSTPNGAMPRMTGLPAGGAMAIAGGFGAVVLMAGVGEGILY